MVNEEPIISTLPRCLTITEKVSFNIASEASYVYILSGQKLIKRAKNGPFRRVLENLKLAVKQFQKFKCDILSDFQTVCTIYLRFYFKVV